MKRSDRLRQRQEHALNILRAQRDTETASFTQQQDAWNDFVANRKSLPVCTQEAADALAATSAKLHRIERDITALEIKLGYATIPIKATSRYTLHHYLRDMESF